MTIFIFVLLGIWMLKLYTITRAVFWLWRHGAEYRRKVEAVIKKTPPAARSEFYEVLDRFEGARFLPFGLNDYRVRRLAETSTSFVLRIVGFPLRRIFDGNYLAAITSAGLFLLGFSHDPAKSSMGTLGWWPVFALAIAPLLTVLMLCIESATAYATMRSYALFAFHIFSYFEYRYFNELIVVLGLVGRAILGSGTAVYVSTIFACAFKGDALVRPIPMNFFVHCELFVQSLYFSVVTIATVGYGDISPATFPGQMIALLTILVSWSLVTFLLASLSAIVSDQNAAKPE